MRSNERGYYTNDTYINYACVDSTNHMQLCRIGNPRGCVLCCSWDPGRWVLDTNPSKDLVTVYKPCQKIPCRGPQQGPCCPAIQAGSQRTDLGWMRRVLAAKKESRNTVETYLAELGFDHIELDECRSKILSHRVYRESTIDADDILSV